MTIPLGPEDINKTARVVDHVSNIASILRGRTGRSWSATGADLEAIKEAARLDERYREYAAGEVVRIKDYREGVNPFSDRPAGKGMAMVLIEPLDGSKERSFYAQAHNLETVEDTRTEADVLRDAGLWRDPVTGNLHRYVERGQVRALQGWESSFMTPPPLAHIHIQADGTAEVMTPTKAHRIANAHKSVARKLSNLAQDYKETAEDWELLSKSLANLKEQTES